MKTIEFKYTAEKPPIEVVKDLQKILNIKYHHHYIKERGIGVLEYFEI